MFDWILSKTTFLCLDVFVCYLVLCFAVKFSEAAFAARDGSTTGQGLAEDGARDRIVPGRPGAGFLVTDGAWSLFSCRTF